jgi:hypothetical protein
LETKKLDSERDLMNKIRLGVADIAITFRVNVMSGKTNDGRFISSGAPKGYSDLSGHRKSDGRAIYLEVKTGSGKATPEQLNFLEQMRATGAIAGIVRSVEHARSLILL